MMLQIKVVLQNGDSATWQVNNFLVSEGVFTYWDAKTNEEIALDMDEIGEISGVVLSEPQPAYPPQTQLTPTPAGWPGRE